MGRKVISHYKWLNKNYETVYKNVHGHHLTYIPNNVSAHGDKLSNLRYACEDADVPFYKVSAIGLLMWYDKENGSSSKNFTSNCIKLYHEHPEWFEGCGGEEDAIDTW